jgi:hypothetical protein
MNRELTSGRNRTFWLGIALCTLYQCYRYPLQINELGFSPSYSATPPVLQAGKFLLAVPLIAASLLRWIGNSARLKNWPVALATLFLAGYSLFKILGSADAQYVDVSFWLLFSLMLVLAIDGVSLRALDKYFLFLLVFALGSTLIEVLLFVVFGRLPSMGIPGTYFVRFGGFLDDPNGFSAILYLLMGWSYSRFRGVRRFFVMASLIASELLTQSWTAIIFLFVVALVWTVIVVSRRPLLRLVVLCLLPFVAILFARWYPPLAELGMEILEAKQGSVEGHMFPWAEWGPRWTRWAAFGNWNYGTFESWWAGATVNFGLFWVAVYMGLVLALLISVFRARSRASSIERPVYSGILFFGVFFAFGCLSLPFPIKFPINSLFFVLSFLVAFEKIAAHDTAPMLGRVPLLTTATDALAGSRNS